MLCFKFSASPLKGVTWLLLSVTYIMFEYVLNLVFGILGKFNLVKLNRRINSLILLGKGNFSQRGNTYVKATGSNTFLEGPVFSSCGIFGWYEGSGSPVKPLVLSSYQSPQLEAKHLTTVHVDTGNIYLGVDFWQVVSSSLEEVLDSESADHL